MDMVMKDRHAKKSHQIKRGAHNHSVEDGGIHADKLALVEKESTKVALEMNHGLLVEALKNFMFTAPASL